MTNNDQRDRESPREATQQRAPERELELKLKKNPDDEDAKVDHVLHRDLFDIHRFDWSDGSSEFHISHGDMIRLLRSTGFEVLDLIELRPGPDATTTYPYVDIAWARRWSVEEVWRARKRP